MQFEAQKPNRAAAGVFKILVEAVCGTTAADGVQDYIVSSPHAMHLMQYYYSLVGPALWVVWCGRYMMSK